MKRVTLGSTGETVSEMCLGTQMYGDRCDEAESDRILSTAMDAGVDFIDTAALYVDGRTEEILGRLLKRRRDKVFLLSKVRIGRIGVLESIEQSLRRLQTDHLDLYLIHAPMPGMDPHQIMHDLNRLVREGKTRYVGCSNYPAWLVSHSNCIAEREGWAQLVCNQIPYSLIERGVEVEILPQSYAENIATMAYRPLAMGVLSGKYVPSQQPPQDSRAVADARIPRWLNRYSTQISAFLKMADTVGVTPVALALGWVRACPAITSPVVGASSLQQLESHLKAFEFSLTHEQYRQLNEIFAATEPWEEVSVADFRDWRRNLGLVKR